MRKIIFILIISVTYILSAQALRAEPGKKELFVPCQYKNSYKYYMQKGEDYLADNQLESAYESFKRALIVQPNSQEARVKIVMIKEALASSKESAVERAKRAAIARAMKQAYAGEEGRLRAEEETLAEHEGAEEAVSAPPAPTIPKVPQKMPAKPPAKEIAEKPTVAAKPAVKTKPAAVKPKAAERPSVETGPSVKTRPSVETGPSIETKPAAVKPKAQTGIAEAKPKAEPIKPEAKRKTPPKSQPTPIEKTLRAPITGLAKIISPLDDFNYAMNKKMQDGASNINENIAPNKITGEYRLSLGIDSDNLEWKDANADYHNMPGDTSWRYIFGQDKQNSYDKKVYSRLKMDIDDPIGDHLYIFNQIVIDPWTFVGKNRVSIAGSGGDSVQMDLKYWSNARRTINETYRTQRGDIVNIQENKVHDGKTSPETYRGLVDWGSNRFSVPQVEVDRMYVPLRKSWVEYKDDPYQGKLFFMASQDEALTSDDPLRLSNNKAWWEESPWLDTYDHSRVFERGGVSPPVNYGGLRQPLKKGQWVRNQSFIARDSEDQRLTFLRGGSFNADFDNGTSVSLVAASPRNLWDSYDEGTSIPAALRVKAPPITKKLNLGTLLTSKTGMRHNSAEAFNNLFAFDGSYELFPNTELLAEIAASRMDVGEASGYNNHYTGYAGMVGLKNQGSFQLANSANNKYDVDMGLASMSHNFYPGLSNYRFTRKDFEFAKHIHLDKLRPENEAMMVGNGIDVGRYSYYAKLNAEFPDSNIDTRFDFRTVHSDGGSFIENIFRGEGEYKPAQLPKLTTKALAYFQHLPKTTIKQDPLINAKNSYSAFTDYFAYDDIWLENTIIPAGKDPSIGAFSLGLKYDFCDYFSAAGIVETTNDPKDWPRGLLNNAYVTDEYKDGIIWDKVVPLLYSQSTFGIPPYQYYGIYKGSATYYPFKPIKMTFNYVYNENKYAMAIDDNSTHQGFEIEYKPNARLTLGGMYQYTRQRDMYKEFVLMTGEHYDGHHNIFGALDYELNDNQHLTLMFGEYVGYNYVYPEEHNALTALDTRHIFRIVYSGGWGIPYKRKEGSSLDDTPNPMGEFNPSIPGASFIANFYPGWAKYEEKYSVPAVKSKWDDYYGRMEFGVDCYDKEELEGGLRAGLFTSLQDKEKSDYTNGRGEYFTSDTSFRGADINGDLGWAINMPSKYVTFTPLVNAGYRRIEFDRSKISSPSGLSGLDARYNVSYLGAGARLGFAIYEKWNLYASGFAAPLVYAPCSIDASGDFHIDKGDIYHTEGGLEYLASDRFNVNVGGFWDYQHLDRAQRINSAGSVVAEFPDTKLETFGLKLGGLYKF